MIDFDDIYSRYNIEDIAIQRGAVLKGSSRGKWCLCILPYHTHRSYTPSFSIYWHDGRQYWKCHGQCNVGGDVIDLAGYLWVPGYNPEIKGHKAEAARTLTNDRTPSPKMEPPPPIPTLPQWLWKDMLPPSAEVVKYALSRGLTINEIDKFRIGTPKIEMAIPYNIYAPERWMSMPTFHDGQLAGIKLRNVTNRGMRYMGVAGSRKGLFNYDAVNMTDKSVLVLKGEIAVMIADRFGLLACAPTGGEGSYVKEVRHALIFSRNIVVGDNDPGEGAERAKEQAIKRAAVLNAEVYFPPPQYQDFDKWVLGDPRAVDQIKEWMK